MRNIIGTLVIALLAGCGGSGNGGGQLPLNWEPPALDIGNAGPLQPAIQGQPSLDELKAALALEFERLGVDPSKATSSAPSGKGVDVADLGINYDLDEETQSMLLTLDWTGRLAGDNDFNGEVNLSDLQPLVAYWEQEAKYKSFAISKGIDGFPKYRPHVEPEFSGTFEGENWVKCQIDSDNNGEINLSDITGIVMHFQQSLGGYNVYRRMAGESSFTRLPNPNSPLAPATILSEEAYQQGTANPSSAQPQRFSIVDPDQTPGLREYYVVATDSQGNEGEGNPYVLNYFLNDTELDPPIGQFSINGLPGGHLSGPTIYYFAPGQQIELDPSSSHAKENGSTIVEYAYDIEGDGNFNYVRQDNIPIVINVPDEGVSLLRLRVTDSNGLMDFFERPVFIGVNHPTTVGMQIDLGDGFVPTRVSFSSQGTYDRDSIIRTEYEYWWHGDIDEIYTFTTSILSEPGDYTCRMTVTDAFGNESSLEKEFSLSVGGYVNPGWRFAEVDGNAPEAVFSTRIIGGKPAVIFGAMIDGTPGLYYNQASDQAGTEWGTSHTVSAELYDKVLFSPYLLEVNGLPIVAYFEGIMFGRAMFSHANSADGSSWSNPIMFAEGSMSMHTLGISNGRPIIVAGGLFGVNVFSALDPLGDSWSEPQPFEGQYGLVHDWINVNGQEGFILDGSGNSLVLRPQDTNDPWEELISLPEDVGDIFQTQAVCDGLLTFWQPGTSHVQQVQAQTKDAKVWQEPQQIDLLPNSNATSIDVLAIEGSPPWMCVYDYIRFELLFMQANDLQASSWGEPEVVTSYGDVGHNCKLVEVNGQPGIVYNDRTTDTLMIAIKE